MNTLALILGRGGSKGLPGKNTRMLAGRPCIAWSIETARTAHARGAVRRIALSTDDPQQRKIGAEHGIDVVARPAELARDETTIDAAARHAVLELERDDARFDAIAILYANVPVRPHGLIDHAIAMLRDTGADSVQSYSPVGKHHPWWMAVVGDDGAVRPWEGDVLNHGVFRRQDLPPAHVPDGGVLVVRRSALFLEIKGAAQGPHAFLGFDRRGIVNPEGSVIDIDGEIDALVADFVLSTGRYARREAA